MNIKGKLFAFCMTGALFALCMTEADAQETTSEDTAAKSGEARTATLRTVKLNDARSIKLDGKLDEAIWQSVPVATGFTQRSPNDGQPATERTEARVVYTDDAIYVGFKAYDSSMDSVAATLFRKDGSAYSDWVYVGIDSYNDNRTSFNFAVNPKGVRKDILIYDNDREDIRWDAVWEAKTTIQEDGWTAELRIPLSQLRYSTSNAEQSWGINFQRRIARNEEIAFWSPTPRDASGFVSQYGQLEGISDLDEPGRLELIPYASTSLTMAPDEPGNPFYESSAYTGSVGGDLKYGLTSDLTLTATLNPDFGQVEADPAVINLSANETFFDEQRPFFLEGNEIFRFGNTKTYNTFGNPITFYTRRIGRTPQGNLNRYNDYNNQSAYDPGNAEDIYTDPPDQTTIAGAAKVSGKTRSGWSIGLLDAYTVKETTPYQVNLQGGGSREGDFIVQPSTNYLVARAKKDFNGANTIIGGFLSATNRNIGNTYFETYLHNSAYLAGVDFEQNFDNRNWTVSGAFSMTQVNGTAEAIERTQRSPVRYYNRVDSDALSLDPDKTSLSGFASELSVRKSGGDHWRMSATYSQVSPGYEANDLGFQNRADYHAIATGLTYQENDPKWLRYYEVWSFETWAWNYDGDLIGNYYNAGGYWQFNNLWSFNANVNFNGPAYMDRLTRGGPVAKLVPSWNFNFNINSDQTRKVSFNVGSFNRWDFPPDGVTREYDHSVWAGLTVRPATNIQISWYPEINYQRDNDQYVTAVNDALATDTYGTRYVFADIEQTVFSSSIRVDWTFTPDISLQFYARPFVSTGNFYNYKEFTEPRELAFDIYGQDRGTISASNGTYTVDPDGTGPATDFSFQERDFNFRSIQGNAVFRWEYSPGATLFLVWQHDRSSFGPQNDFYPGRDFSRLFREEATNVFLVKLSYWFGT